MRAQLAFKDMTEEQLKDIVYRAYSADRVSSLAVENAEAAFAEIRRRFIKKCESNDPH